MQQITTTSKSLKTQKAIDKICETYKEGRSKAKRLTGSHPSYIRIALVSNKPRKKNCRS